MDDFTVFIIVVAIGFHLGLTLLIFAYICYKECTCSCPKKRQNVIEEELQRTVQNGENTNEQEETPDNSSQEARQNARVNVYFTNRWVSSLANRIQSYVSRRNHNDPEGTPTVVITGSMDFEDGDEDNYLPCYNEALALEIRSMKSSVISLDSPPSYEDIFAKIQQTRL